MSDSDNEPTQALAHPEDHVFKGTLRLPADPLEQAGRRLSMLSLLAGLGFLLYLIVDVFTAPVSGAPSPEDPYLTGLGVVVSLLVFLLARRSSISPWAIFDLSLIYLVTVAAIISTAEAISDLQPGDPVWGVSWVCLLLIAYPVLLPNRVIPAVAASFLAAITGPAAYMVVALVRGRAVSPFTLVNMYAPNFIAFLLAAGVILVMRRLEQSIRSARLLGGYRLQERIGAGGMGEVWRAEHAMLARPAAIKIIHSARPLTVAEEADLQGRFKREAEIISRLTSPHTITLFDFGTTAAGQPYYVMELLRGIDLARMVQRFGAIGPGRTIQILGQMCASLEEAHVAGFVHRDVKPGNVMLCRKGTEVDFVQVLDFGLARPEGAPHATGTGLVTGTLAYLAPEILRGRPATAASDIYALGRVGCWLLTGTLEEPPKPVPADGLTELLRECVANDPGSRPASCGVIRERLEGLTAGRPWPASEARSWWAEHLDSELASSPTGASRPAL